jgi:hypothetical protein
VAALATDALTILGDDGVERRIVGGGAGHPAMPRPHGTSVAGLGSPATEMPAAQLSQPAGILLQVELYQATAELAAPTFFQNATDPTNDCRRSFVMSYPRR